MTNGRNATQRNELMQWRPHHQMQRRHDTTVRSDKNNLIGSTSNFNVHGIGIGTVGIDAAATSYKGKVGGWVVGWLVASPMDSSSGFEFPIRTNSIQFNSIQFKSLQFNSIQFNSIHPTTPLRCVTGSRRRLCVCPAGGLDFLTATLLYSGISVSQHRRIESN